MPRPITDILRDIRFGNAVAEIDASLGELTDAVIATRKAGTLTIKLEVKPNGENSVTMTDDHAVKLPKPDKGKTMFFVSDEGDLLRDNPRQSRLPLRDITEPADRGDENEAEHA